MWAQLPLCKPSHRRKRGKERSAAGLERRQRCLCATEEGLGRLEPSSPARLTALSLTLCPGPPLTNFLPPVHPALPCPTLPTAPAISLFLLQLTCTGIENVAFNPNPRANQKETKQPQDRDDALRQPRRSVSGFWTDQMLFVIRYQRTNSTATEPDKAQPRR